MNLNEIGLAKKFVITKINLKKERAERFNSLGVIVGEEGEIERVAPLGDPIVILISSVHLAIRREDAGLIMVREIE